MGRVHKGARVLAPVVALITSSMLANAQVASPTTQPIGAIPGNQANMQIVGPATTQGAKEIMLNFKDAPVDTILTYVAENFGYTVIRDRPIEGRVTLIARHPVTPAVAMIQLNAALKSVGYTAVEQLSIDHEKMLRIISRDTAATQNLPVQILTEDPTGANGIEESDEMITMVIPVASVDAARLRQDLAPLLAGTTISNAGSNTIIITDSKTNIRRIASIIWKLDQHRSTASTMKTRKLKFANAAATAKVILSLFKPDATNPQAAGGNLGGGGAGGGRGGRGGGGGGAGGFGGGGGGGGLAGAFGLGGLGGGAGGGRGGGGTGAIQAQINAVADDRTNILITTGPDDVLKDIDALVTKLEEDTLPDSEVRIFKLIHSDAETTAKELQTLFNSSSTSGANGGINPAFFNGFGRGGGGGGGGPAAFLAAIGNSSADATKAVPVNITADDRTNSVILTGPILVLDQVEKLIKKLDDDPVPATEVRIFQLRNADADSAVKLLQSVFTPDSTTSGSTSTLGGGGGGGGFGGGGGGRGGGGFGGGGGRGGFGGGVNFGGSTVQNTSQTAKPTFADDERTNTVVVTAPSEMLKVIETILDKLETNPSTEQTIFIYRLRNAQSANLQTVLNNLFGNSSGAGGGGTAGRAGSTSSLTSSRNSGVGGTTGGRGGGGGGGGGASSSFGNTGGVTSSARNVAGGTRGGGTTTGGSLSSSQRATNELSGQVYVVADTDTNSLLVTSPSRYQDQVKQIIAELDRPVRQVLIQAMVVEVTHTDGADYGTDLNFLNLNATNHGITGNSVLGNIASQNTNGGMVISVLQSQINATLHLLQQEGKLDVLSRPSILATDNQEATIQVGQNFPYISDVTATTTGQINTVTYASIGIILDVTPHINPDGLVTLDVSPQISSIADSTVQISAGVVQPIINTRQADSRVQVRDGNTVVIGGLMQDQKTSTVNKVPILGDIPLIGNIFKRTQTNKVKTELMIFLTPHVAAEPEELRPMSEDILKGTVLTPNAVEPGVFQKHLREMERGTNPDAPKPAPIDPVTTFDLSTGAPATQPSSSPGMALPRH